MPNVRKYLKDREKRQSGKPDRNYKEKIRSHRLVVFYRVLLAIALLAALITMIVIQWKNKVYTQSMVTASVTVQSVQNTISTELNGSILTYSKDGANLMDAKGNVVWNQTFEMQDPILDTCGSVAAIGDYNGRTIYVMDTSGSLGKIDTNMPIRDFRVAANGVVAAVLDDAKLTWIYLFDAKGNQLVHFKTTMENSGYPVSMSISSNGQLMGISYLFVDSGVMKTKVGFYNFGEVGKNSIDNFVGAYDYTDKVIPVIQFMNAETLFAVADDRIIFYSGDQIPVNIGESLLEEEVQGVYYSKDYVGLVFIDSTGESRYRLDIYNTTGNKVHSQFFDLEFTDIIFSKDLVIIYNENQCRIDTVKGVNKFEGTFDKAVRMLLPTSVPSKYVLMTSDSIDTIELK